jgi:hypothetical protein
MWLAGLEFLAYLMLRGKRGDHFLASVRPTARITRLGWEGRFACETGFRPSQEHVKKRGAYPKSGACIVRRTPGTPTEWIDNELQTHLDQIVLTTRTLAMTKKLRPYKTLANQRPDMCEHSILPRNEVEPTNLDEVLLPLCQ